MTVVISPNPKKTSHRILPTGDIIDARTKERVGTTKEEEFVAPVQVAKPEKPTKKDKIKTSTTTSEEKKSNPLAEAIKAQVQAQIQKTMAEIDIASMVKEAIEEAFE